MCQCNNVKTQFFSFSVNKIHSLNCDTILTLKTDSLMYTLQEIENDWNHCNHSHKTFSFYFVQLKDQIVHKEGSKRLSKSCHGLHNHVLAVILPLLVLLIIFLRKQLCIIQLFIIEYVRKKEKNQAITSLNQIIEVEFPWDKVTLFFWL